MGQLKVLRWVSSLVATWVDHLVRRTAAWKDEQLAALTVGWLVDQKAEMSVLNKVASLVMLKEPEKDNVRVAEMAVSTVSCLAALMADWWEQRLADYLADWLATMMVAKKDMQTVASMVDRRALMMAASTGVW